MEKRMRKSAVIWGLRAACFILLLPGILDAQGTEEGLFKDLRWRNIGPANMSGRVTDIQALDNDFRHVIVASASGGVWKSTNAGTTWEPIFDRYGSASIGAVAIFQKNPDIIWVGTGEANVRNSVGWGDGVYQSTDGGQTFVRKGLDESHHIARIVTHPDDPEIVIDTASLSVEHCIDRLLGYLKQNGYIKRNHTDRSDS